MCARRASVSRPSVRARFGHGRPSRSRALSVASPSRTSGDGMGEVGLRASLTPRSTTTSAAKPTDGSLGDMTELSTAANDPLFYAITRTSIGCGRSGAAIRCGARASRSIGAFLEQRFPFPWIDGTIITVSVADTLDTRRLGYTSMTARSISRRPADHRYSGGCGPADAARSRNAVLATPYRGDRVLRIAGVQPGDRPISVEIALASPAAIAPRLSVLAPCATAAGKARLCSLIPSRVSTSTAALRWFGTSSVMASYCR